MNDLSWCASVGMKISIFGVDCLMDVMHDVLLLSVGVPIAAKAKNGRPDGLLMYR